MMRGHQASAIAFLAVAAFAMAAPAAACQPDPPSERYPEQLPNQSAESFKETLKQYNERMAKADALKFERQRQAALAQETARWDSSESVMLAQVTKVGTTTLRDADGRDIGTSPKITLKPVKWLKGKGKSRPFSVQHEGSTSCGYYGGGDAVYGKPGSRYVVFVTKGVPSMKTISDTVGGDRASDPRTKAALGL